MYDEIGFDEVDIWVGRFPSEATVETYFRETYNADDDDEPISPFAADMGEFFYDHDWMELGDYHDPPIRDLAKALSGHSFSASYLESAVEAFNAVPREPFNFVLLISNHEIQRPVSVKTSEYSLEYLGRFDGDLTAESHSA